MNRRPRATRGHSRSILPSDVEFICNADRRAFYLRTEPDRFKTLMDHIVLGRDGRLTKR